MNSLDRIDQIFRALDRELWILVAATPTARGGLTATSVQAAHIDREAPLLLASIGANHYTRELMDASGTFVAQLLRPEQFEVGWQFAASSGRSRDKFAGLATSVTPGGALRLADCHSWLECRIFARLETGDRVYFWSDVVDAGDAEAGPILTAQEFFRRLAPEQRSTLQRLQHQDVELQRPLLAAWRAALPNLLRPRP